ncbi:hypothetical protein [Nonomuraea sp. NPDC050783]|uniref:hypothetical protein n=1 Tax=Nonomuraea sp. NPDC050783 TaxID=3154634 RepID=UPI00346794B8
MSARSRLWWAAALLLAAGGLLLSFQEREYFFYGPALFLDCPGEKLSPEPRQLLWTLTGWLPPPGSPAAAVVVALWAHRLGLRAGRPALGRAGRVAAAAVVVVLVTLLPSGDSIGGPPAGAERYVSPGGAYR